MMKKILIEAEVMKKLVDSAALFSAEANSQITLCFGKNVKENAFLNTASIVAGTEQLQTTFTTSVPAGYEAEYEEVAATVSQEGESARQKVLIPYFNGTFKVSDFVGTVGILLALDEMLFLQLNESGVCTVGTKDNSVKLQLEMLAEEQRAFPVSFDRKACLTKIQVKVTEFMEALRIGGSMVHSDAEDARGLGNVLMAMQYSPKKNELVEGAIKVYSTNATAISRGGCKAYFQEDDSMQQKKDAVLEKRKLPFLVSGIPKKSYIKLLKILKEVQACYMFVSEKHVCVMNGSDMMFTFIQGANMTPMVFKADDLQKEEKSGFSVVCDTENLKSKVDILNKVSNYKKFTCPLLLTVSEKIIQLEVSGKKDVGTVKVPLLESTLKGKKVRIYFDGAKLATVIGCMKKGNITLGCAQVADCITYPVQISNGDNDSTEVVFLFAVRGPQTQEKEDTQELTTE